MTSEPLSWEDSLGDLIAPGDVVDGKYRVERVLGVGGMGVVVEAWHLHFDERVAIKFLAPEMAADDEARARFEREARAAFKIRSVHVARVIDVGQLAAGSAYLVMEYLDGMDLATLLAQRGRLPVVEAVDYLLQASEAVAEAHVLGIVHRDLKPENLFLTRLADGSPCIKVLDFGLSKAPVQRGQGRERALTAGAQVMGTPHYMSPEQWMSARDVGPATDVWSLGVILYELVAGGVPFAGERLAQQCAAVLSQPPRPLGSWGIEAPAALVAVLDRCLQKDPAARYPNVGELAARLCECGSRQARESARHISRVLRVGGVDVKDEPPASIDYRRAGAPVVTTPALPVGLCAVGPAPGPGAAEPTGLGQAAAGLTEPVVRAPVGPTARPAVTAQSWQQLLPATPPRRRWTARSLAALAVLAAVGSGAWLLVRRLAGPEPGTPAGAKAATAVGVAPAADSMAATAREQGASPAGSRAAAPVPAAAATGSAGLGPERTPPRLPPRRLPNPANPVSTLPSAVVVSTPVTPSSAPRTTRDLFHDRN